MTTNGKVATPDDRDDLAWALPERSESSMSD